MVSIYSMIYANNRKGNCGPFPHAGQQNYVPPCARALYIHVPFCLAKCSYCDFYSIPVSSGAAEAYVAAAAAELAMQAKLLAGPLDSVYVGGGTPTAMPVELLDSLLSLVGVLIDDRTELTVEANPCTIRAGVVETLARRRVNRVTLGVQSFDNGELALLGRLHSAEQVPQAAAMLRQAGITNIGFDLIYGIPGQTLASWSSSLASALRERPAHLSCYALSFETGTPLETDLRAGKVREMDDECQRACYEAAVAAAGKAGMEHYELSNFAAASMRCRHNITYWQGRPYVGIGPAAASYIGGARRKNDPDLKAYIDALSGGSPPPAATETLTGRPAMAEALMLGLRMIEGISRSDFAGRFGADLVSAFPRSIGR